MTPLKPHAFCAGACIRSAGTRSASTRRLPGLVFAVLAATVMLAAACDDDRGGAGHPEPQKQTAPASAAPPTEHRATTGKSGMSALQNLIVAYATPPSPGWEAFGSIQGVAWNDQSATHDPDARPENAYSRSGKLTLAGFGETDLPNGKTGVDADYVRGNEGRAGLTLNGTKDQVTSIAVMKFYADQDYVKVLQAQFGAGSVQPITRTCRLAEGTSTGEANYARNAFFRVSLPGGRSAFAEASVDEEGAKYTPGSTTYFFYRSEPTERIQSMACERI